MASSSSSPQKRSIASPKIYDAFISHRGPDVKDTLAKQLYECLEARGCLAFLDREEIQGGDSIPFAIRNGIFSSVVQIAIFSKGYADSPWCLDELVDMLEQSDAVFIPVFYDVKPWELRRIENEKSRYAAAFSHYQSERRNLDKLDKWKKALADAADKSGYELSQHQEKLCEKIVSRVLQLVQENKNRVLLDVAKYPVGLAELVQDFESSCSETARGKLIIAGIFGLGGSGKTTLAKELFNRKCSGFHKSCFLSDVRESHAKGELHCLQNQLFEALFGSDPKIKSVHEGIGNLKDHLRRARNLHFLIVLDDVDHPDQLDALLPESMLSSGSLVIITTREKSVLRGADMTYRMKVMDEGHAKELFCSHAFRGRDPPISYEKLVERFVEFCGGLPLSLKVLGAHVYGRDEYHWELEFEKVKKVQPKDIMQRLKISFDGLDEEEKQIFIDIACCFNKMYKEDMKRIALSIWKASGWSAEHSLQTLQDKSLVEVDDDDFHVFRMHDHLRDLGRQMADELGPPRLWRPDVLRSMYAKEFQKILAETKGRCFHRFEDLFPGGQITYFVSSLNDSAETQLLYLDIPSIPPYRIVPTWIPLRKLGCLTLQCMDELWSTFQQQLQTDPQAGFELRKFKISESPSSQNRLPDLIGLFSHLEELEIESSLKETDMTSFLQSVKQLSNLRSLRLSLEDFSGSLNLEASTSSRMKLNSLETIEFRGLSNISKLVISGEICPRLRSLEVNVMGNLNEMHLKQLKRLNTLIVRGCPKLETVSGLSSLTGLQSFTVLGCGKMETIAGLSSLTGLQSLEVTRCHKLETISGLSSLTELQVFTANDCEGLKSLPTFAHLRRLERITIVEWHQLQSIEGFEELQGLKSLQIEVPCYGDALIRKCVDGLKRLPSEYTVLIRQGVDEASSKLDANLFSDVSVAEIERGEYSGRNSNMNMKEMKMESLSTTITIYALLVTPGKPSYMRLKGGYSRSLPHGSVQMITVLLTPHTKGSLEGISIEKGFVATVNEGEEGKALTLLQTIVDRLYVVKRKRKQMY